MSDQSEIVRDGEHACSRRTVLRTGGAAIGAVATSGVAAAQNETGTDDTPSPSPIITMAVTLEQENVEGDLTGMWIHFSRPVEPVQASIADQCDIVDWGDQDTFTYDAVLIDRRNEVYQQPIQVYLPRRAEVGGGDLFIVNDTVPCKSGYIGIELEQIGARNIDAGIKPGEGLTETDVGAVQGDGGEGGGFGPWFGLFGAVGGLFGGGWLLNRDDGD